MAISERVRLERMLAGVEGLVKQSFMAFLRDVRSDAVIREVANALERRDFERAFKIVDSYIARFSAVIPRAFQRAARLEMEHASETLKPLAGVVALSFDPGDLRAAQLMRRAQLQFIRDFSAEQRRATTRALSEALATGAGPIEAARAFRDSIGLSTYQQGVVSNYRRLLVNGEAEALDRAVRDRRFDSTVRSAVRTGEPLSSAQINRMTDRYRERFIMLRAETIARTESTRVTSMARQEAFRQTVDDLGLDRSQLRRVWNATHDARTRDSHRDMDGQEVAFDQPFVSGLGNRLMYPGDPSAPIEDTIQCRCVVTNRVMDGVQKAFDPNQPRDPKGTPTGGQWTDGGQLSSDKPSPDKPSLIRATPEELKALEAAIIRGDEAGGNVREVKIDHIRGWQNDLDPGTVDRYRARIRVGEDIFSSSGREGSDVIVQMFDGKSYLSEGYHRVEAAKLEGKTTIRAQVFDYGWADDEDDEDQN